MKIRALLDYISQVIPHVVPESILMLWLNELEGRIQLDVHLKEPGDLVRYKLPDDENTKLLLPMPHAGMYRIWLEAMIHQQRGEYQKYQNDMQNFNAAWTAYVCWYAETGQA